MNPYGAPPPQGPPPQGYPQQGYPQHGYPQQHAPNPYGNPFPPAPPKKSSSSSCLVIALVVVGCAVLAIGSAAFFIWREAGGLLGGMKDLAAIMIDAQSAEGAAEVRDLGCDEAMVVDTGKLEDVLTKLEAEIAKKENRKPKPVDFKAEGSHLVICKVNAGKAPTCDEVAKTFSKAASPRDKFLVSVSKGSGSENCSMAYTKDGAQIGKVKAPDIPQ